MSISQTYSEVILEKIIRDILDEGIALSVSEIETRYNAFVSNQDLSEPLFNIDIAVVDVGESNTTTKQNQTNIEIARDLAVLYKELFSITDDSIKSFDRWRTELLLQQAQIRKLDSRITNLLRTQIERNTHFIIDNFENTSLIDTDNTTALISLKENTIALNLSNTDPTRITLNNLLSNNVEFSVLTRQNLQSVIDAPGGSPINAFFDVNNFWQTRVTMKTGNFPVTCELKVKITSTIEQVSKIVFKLHSANTSGAIQITPLISSDGANFSTLNVSNPTQSVSDTGTWSFPSIEVSVIKFVMTKTGYDVLENNNYTYEFGAEEIAFYNENFEPNLVQQLITTPLFAPDLDGNPIEFDSVTIETCERIPDNTSINYFISPLSTPNGTPIWTQIEPATRSNNVFPSQRNFGNIDNVTLTDFMVSFDSTSELINPASTFFVIDFSSGIPITNQQTFNDRRYVFLNSNERILDHQINNSSNVVLDSVEIFRNVGARGDVTLVRNLQRGWSYVDPFYITNVEVFSENGLSIDFGDQQIIIDNNSSHGKVLLSKGIHNIKINKNNWIPLLSGIVSLDNLKNIDKLFPFNHKYLIEGYSLPEIDNPYKGVDIFAGYYMKQVSIYDLSVNVTEDDYSKFAIDQDIAFEGKESNIVFVVKSNENYSDFLDELFTIRFDIANQLYKYLKLKVEFLTTDSSVTPNLDGYKLKIAS